MFFSLISSISSSSFTFFLYSPLLLYSPLYALPPLLLSSLSFLSFSCSMFIHLWNVSFFYPTYQQMPTASIAVAVFTPMNNFCFCLFWLRCAFLLLIFFLWPFCHRFPTGSKYVYNVCVTYASMQLQFSHL